jgi:hypothetical protein
MNISASIRDDELTAFVEGRAKARKVSVIVEANAPVIVAPSYISKPRSSRQGALLPRPVIARKQVVSSYEMQNQRQSSAMQTLRRDLELLGLAEKASENDFAGAFVVEVTPTQLRNLANLDSVRAIRPNKLRRIA